jgi:hypothetical protein
MYDHALDFRDEIVRLWRDPLRDWTGWLSLVFMEEYKGHPELAGQHGRQKNPGPEESLRDATVAVRGIVDDAKQGDLYYVSDEIAGIAMSACTGLIDDLVKASVADDEGQIKQLHEVARMDPDINPGRGMVVLDAKARYEIMVNLVHEDGRPNERIKARVAAIQWADDADPNDLSLRYVYILAYYEFQGRICPGTMSIWREGDVHCQTLGNDVQFGPSVWLSVFWNFIRQSITQVESVGPSRAYKKRAARNGNGDEKTARLKVVHLRRVERHASESGDADAKHVDWSHRWIVDPHRRNQWYPSLKKHQMKWIAAYVKGPQNKPLVVKAAQKIMAVVR